MGLIQQDPAGSSMYPFPTNPRYQRMELSSSVHGMVSRDLLLFLYCGPSPLLQCMLGEPIQFKSSHIAWPRLVVRKINLEKAEASTWLSTIYTAMWKKSLLLFPPYLWHSSVVFMYFAMYFSLSSWRTRANLLTPQSGFSKWVFYEYTCVGNKSKKSDEI